MKFFIFIVFISVIWFPCGYANMHSMNCTTTDQQLSDSASALVDVLLNFQQNFTAEEKLQAETTFRSTLSEYRMVACCRLSKLEASWNYIENNFLRIICKKFNFTSKSMIPSMSMTASTMYTISNMSSMSSMSTMSTMSVTSATPAMLTTSTMSAMSTMSTSSPSTEIMATWSMVNGNMSMSMSMSDTLATTQSPTAMPYSYIVGLDNETVQENIDVFLKGEANDVYSSWACAENGTCDDYYLSVVTFVKDFVKLPTNTTFLNPGLVDAAVMKHEVKDEEWKDQNSLFKYIKVRFNSVSDTSRKCFVSDAIGNFSMDSCTTHLSGAMTDCSCMNSGLVALISDATMHDSTTPMPTTSSQAPMTSMSAGYMTTTSMEDTTQSTMTTGNANTTMTTMMMNTTMTTEMMNTTTTPTATTTLAPTLAGQGLTPLEIQMVGSYNDIKGEYNDTYFQQLLEQQIEEQLKMNDANIEKVVLVAVDPESFNISIQVIFKDENKQNASLNNIREAVTGNRLAITINGTEVKANDEVFNSNGSPLTVMPTPASDGDDEDDDDYVIVVAVVVSLLGIALIIIAVVVYCTISKKKKLAKK